MCASQGTLASGVGVRLSHQCVCCCRLCCCLQHTPLIPMMTLVMAHGLSQELFEKYKVSSTVQSTR